MAKARTTLRSNLSSMTGDLKGLRSAFDGLRSGLATFGVGLGVSSIVGFLSRTLEAAGGLGELAQQLGVSTDALQALQYQAVQAGVSTDELETALAHLTRTIGEAAQGNKTALDAFNRLGVGVLDAQNHIRSTDDVLDDVMRALAAIPDPAKRAAAEMDLLGRSGQKMDTLLAGANSNLAEFVRLAKAAGAVLTPEDIKRADAAADAWARMAFSAEKLGQQLTAGLAPALSYIFELLAHPGPADMTSRVLGQLQGATGQPPAKPGGASHNPTSTADLAASAAARKRDADEALRQSEALNKYISDLAFERDQLRRTAEQQEVYNNLRQAGVTWDSNAGEAIRFITAQIQELRAAQAQTLAEMAPGLADAAKTAGASVDDLESRIGRLAETLGTDLVNNLAASAAGFQSWAQVGQMALQMLIQSAIQEISAATGASSGGIFGGIMSGFVSILGSAIGSFFSPGTAGVDYIAFPGHAEGGRMAAGEIGWVGEKGPELWVPDHGGTVVPAGAGGGGGVYIDQSFHIAADMDEATWKRRAREIKRETFDAVFFEINRGGPYAKQSGRRSR